MINFCSDTHENNADIDVQIADRARDARLHLDRAQAASRLLDKAQSCRTLLLSQHKRAFHKVYLLLYSIH